MDEPAVFSTALEITSPQDLVGCLAEAGDEDAAYRARFSPFPRQRCVPQCRATWSTWDLSKPTSPTV